MGYLVLAVLSSALISILMRVGSQKVENNIGMLAMNYLTCLLIAGGFAGVTQLIPQNTQMLKTLALGAVGGVLFLLSFVLFQLSVKKNGVVLSSVFMKLGLLVPLVMSIVIFSEVPTEMQIVGFVIAIGAIVLINLQKNTEHSRMGFGLIFLLVAGGSADAMSKVYEVFGAEDYSAQFLFYTFLIAFVLCIGYMFIKRQHIGKSEVVFGVLIGIPNFFSAKFLLASLDSIPAVIAYPTFSVATILIVSLVGVAVFKERLSIKQAVGIFAILVSLVLLNI